MPRLYRPSIPVEVKCRAALRQLGELWIDEAIGANHGGMGAFLDRLLFKMAELLNCEVKGLRLDHNPALATRERKGEGKNTIYKPDANDPEFLIYREKHAHHIKTNVRGDGAQYPDRVLIKRARKQKRKPRKGFGRRAFAKATGSSWPKRKLRSANRWPQREMRREKP
jgi:hypothetical protein